MNAFLKWLWFVFFFLIPAFSLQSLGRHLPQRNYSFGNPTSPQGLYVAQAPVDLKAFWTRAMQKKVVVRELIIKMKSEFSKVWANKQEPEVNSDVLIGMSLPKIK